MHYPDQSLQERDEQIYLVIFYVSLLVGQKKNLYNIGFLHVTRPRQPEHQQQLHLQWLAQ